MSRMPLRRLYFGRPVASDRVMFTDLWWRGHNNARWAEFLARLDRVDRYHFVCSDRRFIRGLQFRALRKTKRLRYRSMFAAAERRGYASLLVNDREQIDYFGGRVVADCDDPKFNAREVELLNRPNVAACVMVTESMAKRYQEAGVEKPYAVVPHGVNLRSLTPEKTAEVAKLRRDGELVVGYQAAWLLSEGDRNADNPIFSVDHLLELWDEIRGRVPTARLWLLGNASKRLRERCAGRDDIVVFGRIAAEDFLSYVANFDIALYPRTADHGTFQTTKVVEYMGCGLPTVAYDYEITAQIGEENAGLLVKTPREFVEAVETLARDEGLRRGLGEAARRVGATHDYDILGRRYAEVLDRYL